MGSGDSEPEEPEESIGGGEGEGVISGVLERLIGTVMRGAGWKRKGGSLRDPWGRAARGGSCLGSIGALAELGGFLGAGGSCGGC